MYPHLNFPKSFNLEYDGPLFTIWSMFGFNMGMVIRIMVAA